MNTVQLEYYSWLGRELIGASEKGKTVTLPLPADGTVRALLADLAADSARFRELVYDPSELRLKEYATLILNGRTIELAGGLGRALAGRRRAAAAPGFSGG